MVLEALNNLCKDVDYGGAADALRDESFYKPVPSHYLLNNFFPRKATWDFMRIPL